MKMISARSGTHKADLRVAIGKSLLAPCAVSHRFAAVPAQIECSQHLFERGLGFSFDDDAAWLDGNPHGRTFGYASRPGHGLGQSQRQAISPCADMGACSAHGEGGVGSLIRMYLLCVVVLTVVYTSGVGHTHRCGPFIRPALHLSQWKLGFSPRFQGGALQVRRPPAAAALRAAARCGSGGAQARADAPRPAGQRRPARPGGSPQPDRTRRGRAPAAAPVAALRAGGARDVDPG